MKTFFFVNFYIFVLSPIYALLFLTFSNLFTGIFLGFWFDPINILQHAVEGVRVFGWVVHGLCFFVNSFMCFFYAMENECIDSMPLYETYDNILEWFSELRFPNFGCKKGDEL